MTIFPMSQWGGLPPIINGTGREDIECQQPAVEFLPRECCVNLLPAPKRSPIQRRRHFVSGSSTFSSTWLSGTVIQSAVTVTHMKCCEVSKMCFWKEAELYFYRYHTRTHANASCTYSMCTHKYSNLVGRGCGWVPRVAHRSWHGVNSSNDGGWFV